MWRVTTCARCGVVLGPAASCPSCGVPRAYGPVPVRPHAQIPPAAPAVAAHVRRPAGVTVVAWIFLAGAAVVGLGTVLMVGGSLLVVQEAPWVGVFLLIFLLSLSPLLLLGAAAGVLGAGMIRRWRWTWGATLALAGLGVAVSLVGLLDLAWWGILGLPAWLALGVYFLRSRVHAYFHASA